MLYGAEKYTQKCILYILLRHYMRQGVGVGLRGRDKSGYIFVPPFI